MGTLAPISFFQVLIMVLIFLAAVAGMFYGLVLVLRKRQSQTVKFDPIHISEVVHLIISVGSFIIVCITLVVLVMQNRIIVAQT